MTRQNPEARRQQILDVARGLAAKTDYRWISCKDIADEIQCSPGLIIHYFDTVDNLRDAIVVEAIRMEDTEVLTQAIVAGHPLIKTMPRALKARVVMSIGGLL